MSELFKRVCEGKVQSLPSVYSRDLNHVVKLCLQVNPTLRPSCESLLAKAQLVRNVPESIAEASCAKEVKDSLIGTIRVPRNLGQITDRLPAANYEPDPEIPSSRR